MTRETLLALAARLTDAQKAWILSPARNDTETSQIVPADAEWDECAEMGLADYWTDRLTDLGISVRDHIRARAACLVEGEGK